MRQSVIGALGFEYGFYCAPLFADNSIKLTTVLPKIDDVLEATKLPFDLLVIDPEELSPAGTQNEKYTQIWQDHQALFGFYALKELVRDNTVPVNKLQVISTSTPTVLETLSNSAKLVIPKESIAYIEIEDQETILQSIIQSRLGMLAK